MNSNVSPEPDKQDMWASFFRLQHKLERIRHVNHALMGELDELQFDLELMRGNLYEQAHTCQKSEEDKTRLRQAEMLLGRVLVLESEIAMARENALLPSARGFFYEDAPLHGVNSKGA